MLGETRSLSLASRTNCALAHTVQSQSTLQRLLGIMKSCGTGMKCTRCAVGTPLSHQSYDYLRPSLPSAAPLTVLPLRGRRHGPAYGRAEVSVFGQLLHCVRAMGRNLCAPVGGYWEVLVIH